MKFASLGHLDYEKRLFDFPKSWISEDLIISPEITIHGISGQIIALKISAEQMMNAPRDEIRGEILKAAVYAQNQLNIDLLQLGALTTSLTDGGRWLAKQKEYTGLINHGDSYTAATACKVVYKVLKKLGKKTSNLHLSILGAYGIIGEAISTILVPKFAFTTLIGRRMEKLNDLEKKIYGKFETTTTLKTIHSDIIITATNHPTALLKSNHLKKNAIVVDVSQPPNLSLEVCNKRKDIIRVDGGYVNFPTRIQLPGVPKGKLLSCIVEVIMQALENDKHNHIGAIDLDYLSQTEKWGEKYGFTLNELTNFGEIISF